MTDPQIRPLSPGDPPYLGKHQLIAVLGTGGMGRVYLGVAPDGGQVAVKVLRSEHAGDPAYRQRFEREVKVAQLVASQFTARVLDAGVDGGIPWLATEYIPGPTLAQVVEEYGPLPDASVRALAAGLARALSEIHSRRIVHRDLKPANVIMSVTGPRVIDFGVARPLDGLGLTVADQLRLGTFGYMPPEQRRGDEVTERGDIYSLGAVLAYAATRKPPPEPARFGEQPDLREVPPALRPLVGACMRTAPEERASLAQVAADCGTAADAVRATWLPSTVEAFVQTRAMQQRNAVTTLLERARGAAAGRGGRWGRGRVGAPPQGQPPGLAQGQPEAQTPRSAQGQPTPAPAAPLARRLRRGYRAAGARLVRASRSWPLFKQPSLRRWTRVCLAMSAVTLTEVVSRTSQVMSNPPGPLRWVQSARAVQAAIRPFTAGLPDPVAAWSSAAGSAVGTDRRLAALALALALLAAVARRMPRAKAYQVAVKAAAFYGGVAVMAALWLRLAQTGLGPLIHTAEYLRWAALLAFAVAALVVYPVGGRSR